MSSLEAGFQDPVFDSQAAFRSVMRAMAEPGRIETIPVDLAPPLPLNLAAASSCLALVDFETPIWLSPTLAKASPVVDYLTFYCGASFVKSPQQAAFAVVDVRSDTLELSLFAQGTAEYPDRSTTVILLCDSLLETPNMVISGPGLRNEGSFGFEPVPANFTEQWSQNRLSFPLGVDLIVTTESRLVCLPRSTRIVREIA